MSTVTMILGQSGTGKTTSLRNLDPTQTLLIQAIKKPLPFKSGNWKPVTKDNPAGSIFICDSAATIVGAMKRTKRPIIVIDDFQYVMANEFMRRSAEKGFEKFTEIGRNAWDILAEAARLPDDVRVYVLSHVETTDDGRTKIKTIGKMLDEKITLEGMVSIVLKTVVQDGQYYFATRNNGSDTVKTPMGMFDADMVENDLAAVDTAIYQYYGLTEAA